MRKVIAIDFDGCLCKNAYPLIGEPNWPVIEQAKKEQAEGAALILWTCREGELLQEAVITATEQWGLSFDAVNESLPEWIEAYGTNPRKVGATEYWDDRAVHNNAQSCPLCSGQRLSKVGIDDLFNDKRIYLCGGNGTAPESERFKFCPECGRRLLWGGGALGDQAP